MQITIKLYATLRIGRFAEAARQYPQGARIADVVSQLHIPVREIGMIMLNNRHADPGQELDDGDNLSIFPPEGGG